MAHFAKIENGIVVEVIVINNNAIDGGNFPESESIGQQFLKENGFEGFYLQTSYNNNFRRHFAGIGYTYDKEKDIFISPQPYPSWSLNEEGDWEPPFPAPNDENNYFWNEQLNNWITEDNFFAG